MLSGRWLSCGWVVDLACFNDSIIVVKRFAKHIWKRKLYILRQGKGIEAACKYVTAVDGMNLQERRTFWDAIGAFWIAQTF